MNLIKKIVMVVLVVSCAGLVSAGDFTVQPYGFVILNVNYNSQNVSNADFPTKALLGDGSGTLNMTARQSRFGLWFKGEDEVRGADLYGKIELDFYGLKADSKTGVTQSAPRLRLAYGQLIWEKAKLTFGQDWVRSFAPLNPNMLSHLSVVGFSAAGNLWGRIPQVRFDYTDAIGESGWLDASFALLRPLAGDIVEIAQADTAGAGEFGKFPFLQGRVGFHTAEKPLVYAAGFAVHYGRERDLRFGADDALEPKTFGMAVDGLFKADKYGAKGEFFSGKNLPMLVSAASYQVVSGMNDAGDTVHSVEELKVKGGWFQVSVTPQDRYTVNAGYGIEDPDDDMIAAGSSTPSRNNVVFGNVIIDLSKHVKFGTEVGYFKTKYKVADETDGNDFVIQDENSVSTNFALQVVFP